MSLFGQLKYWEERFVSMIRSGKTREEWMVSYPEVKAILRANVPQTGRVLHLGIGVSSLAEDMFEDGYRGGLDCVDYSPAAITEMKNTAPDRGGAKGAPVYEVMNARELRFKKDTFDCVLDKGLADPLIYLEETERVATDLDSILLEVVRVLKPGGVYVMFCLGDVNERSMFLQSCEAGRQWSLKEAIKVQDSTSMHKECHCYILQKNGKR